MKNLFLHLKLELYRGMEVSGKENWIEGSGVFLAPGYLDRFSVLVF